MLKILHTADWHVGREFKKFEPEVSRKLARDRISVIERIMGLAEQYEVDAVLCAGDLFDVPDPEEPWWRAVAEVFTNRLRWSRPVVLLPGNHDPLKPNSVYHESHPFRRMLPEWVRVVDRDDFELELGPAAGKSAVGDSGLQAVVYAVPCRTTAGDHDLALTLPARAEGDTRIRIGLLHGSTFDLPGYVTNFPISTDAPAQRGLDYLAIGDTHGFREIAGSSHAPIVYPGTPEPTKFSETDAGFVALVTFLRSGTRPRVRREPVARWTWRDLTARSLTELQAIAADNLTSSIVRLTLDMTVSLADADEVERLLLALHGTDAVSARTGGLVCDRTRLRIVTSDADVLDGELPRAIHDTAEQLRTVLAGPDGDQRDVAQRALVILKRLLREVR